MAIHLAWDQVHARSSRATLIHCAVGKRLSRWAHNPEKASSTLASAIGYAGSTPAQRYGVVLSIGEAQ